MLRHYVLFFRTRRGLWYLSLRRKRELPKVMISYTWANSAKPMSRPLDWFNLSIQKKILQTLGMAWMKEILVALNNLEMIPEKGYFKPREKGYSGKQTQNKETKSGWSFRLKGLKTTSLVKAPTDFNDSISPSSKEQISSYDRIFWLIRTSSRGRECSYERCLFSCPWSVKRKLRRISEKNTFKDDW